MKIAIFGAGQLAMMMIEESSDLGHEFIVIDPASRPPASKLSKHYMVEYNDEKYKICSLRMRYSYYRF